MLHISCNDNPRNIYYLDGTELACTQSEKGVGFTMDESLTLGNTLKYL